MSDERKDKKPKAPISFDHLGGRKVGHPTPNKVEKPIDFSSIGGNCVRKASDHPTAESAESVEKEDDARE